MSLKTHAGAALAALLLHGAYAFGARADAPQLQIPEPLPLEWCLERAREANPALEMASALASAARHRVAPAGALEDPRFSYEASNLPVGNFDFHSTPLSGHQLWLRQQLPLPGLLSNRKGAARTAAEASQQLVEDHQFMTEGAVESAFAELGFAQQALDITERNIGLLRQLSSTAESRYRVGTGLQQDVLRAQVELTALLQERLRRQETIERAESELVALLDLPADSALPRTADLRMSADHPALEPLLASLDERSARLRAASRRVEQARMLVRVAELEGLPDVDLGVGYRVRNKVAGDIVDGDDFFSAGIRIRLPVDRGKWRARVAERRSKAIYSTTAKDDT